MRNREPAPYSKPAKGMTASIEEWQKDTNITVADDARAQIADEVGQADWSKVFVPAEQHEQALAWTRNILVRAYLYSLLDRDRAQHTLTGEEVAAHTFAEFMGTLRNEPFGFIEFLSAPAGARIARDQQEIGRAPMGFIASGDAHIYDIILSKKRLRARAQSNLVPAQPTG